MTKKDYKIIAEALRCVLDRQDAEERLVVVEVVNELEKYISKDNYRFDIDKFEKAIFIK